MPNCFPITVRLQKYEIAEWGNTVAILGLGKFFELGKIVKEKLKNTLGIDATLINPRYVNELDTVTLEKIKSNHRLTITLEDGVISGGFGEKIARFYGNSSMRVLNFGAEKEFADNVSVNELYIRYRLTAEQIVSDISDEIDKICNKERVFLCSKEF